MRISTLPFLLTLSLFGIAWSARAEQAPVPAEIAVCFVPGHPCESAIVAAIVAARHSIRVQAYEFTAEPILRALADARGRGVDVQVILDKRGDEERHGAHAVGSAFTVAADIPTWIDSTVAIAHNKVIVIDAVLVIGGSYNYTASAQRRNAENVTFIRSAEVARQYLDNWTERKARSHPSRFAVAKTAAR